MFTLLDCIAQNKNYPDSYHIPDAAHIAQLKVGDFAKLDFQYSEKYPTPQGVYINTERMWIEITQINGHQFSGKIYVCPINPNLKLGQPVDFEAKHICNVDYK